MKKICIFIILIIIGIYFIIAQSEPFLKKSILTKIESTKNNHNIDLQWKKLTINKIFLEIQLKDIQIKQREDIFYFEKISFRLDFLQSILQRHFIFNTSISGFQLHFNLPKYTPLSAKNILNHLKTFQNFNKIQNQHKIMPILSSLPFHKIKLIKGSVQLNTESKPILFKNIKIYLQNRRSSIHLQIKSLAQTDESTLHLQSESIIQNNMIDLKKFNLRNKNSNIYFSGRFVNSIQAFFLNSKILLSHKELSSWLPHLEIEKNEASLKSEFQISYSKKKGFQGPFNIELKNFKNIYFSQFKIKGEMKKNYIHFAIAHLENPNQTIFLENTNLQINKKFSFKTKIYSYIKNFQFMDEIFKWNSGIRFHGPLESKCHGQIISAYLNCSTKISLNNFSLLYNKLSLFFIPKMEFISTFVWDSKKLSLQGEFLSKKKTNIQFSFIKKDKNPETIPFKGMIDLSEVDSIFNKSVNGKIYFSNSKFQMHPKKYVSITSNIKANQLSLSEIYFGNLKTKMILSKKNLYLKNIIGQLNKSLYKADLHFNFSKKIPLLSLQSQFSPFYLEDLNQSIPPHIKISGQGSAQFSIENSPIHQLNYKLSSSFQNTKFYGESFKKFIFNIFSKKGKVFIDKVLAKKIKGNIEAKGSLSNEMNFQIIGKNLAIEKSENLKKWLNPHISGLLSFHCDLTGSTQNPRSTITSSLTHSFYGSNALEDSKIKFQFQPHSLQGTGHFLGHQLTFEQFKFTDLKNNPNFSAQLKANKWNIIPFISSIPPSSKISSHITGQASIHFPLREIANLSGFIDIEDTIFYQESNKLKSSHPFYVQLNSGAFNFKGSSIKWKSNDQSIILKKINQNKTLLSGFIRLEFLKIFFPFINNIHGELNTNINFNNNLKNFSPDGIIKIQNAILNFIDSFDIFQSFNLDGRFSSNQFEIKNFNAHTSSGKISGNGKIDYSHKNLLPMDIQAYLDKIVFHVSDKIKIKGYGPLRFYGDRKPYFLSGSLDIIEGHFTSEFDKKKEEKNQNLSVKWTPLIKKEDPFHLDISMKFKNPFVIENSLMSTFIDGSIHLTDKYNSPLVAGILNFIPGGKFYIREYDFEIMTGQILYNKNRLNNPQFKITGQTDFEEIQYNQNTEIINRYNIKAEVRGYKNNFHLQLSSQPFLSEQEILSMMTLGARSIGFIGDTQLSDAAQYSYSRIGYTLFQDVIGRGLTNLLGIRFAVTPHINENTNKIATKIWFHKKWYKNLHTSISTFLEKKEGNNSSFSMEYRLTPKISLLGMWKENKTTQEQQKDSNIFSLDIEYKWNF